MKKISLIALVVILLLTGCASNKDKIIGSWYSDELGTLTFYDNGTASMDGEDTNYSIDGDSLIIDGETLTFSIKSSELIIDNGEGEELIFKKQK